MPAPAAGVDPGAEGDWWGDNPSVPTNSPTTNSPSTATSRLAVGALITAIAGFVACGVVLSPAAVIMGVKARSTTRSQGTRGEGLATAAIVVGIVGFVVNVVVLAVVLGDPDILNQID
jgi:hypothetical protein